MAASQEREKRLTDRYGLTKTQARVAVALAEGKTYKEIAAELGITFHTVNTHAKAVLMKTKAGSSRRLAALVYGEQREDGDRER